MCFSMLICRPFQAVELNYLSTLYPIACHAQYPSSPVSPRCLQLALWSIAILESSSSYSIYPSSDRPSILSNEDCESHMITTATSLVKLLLVITSHQLDNQAATESRPQCLCVDPLVSVAGSLVSLGGLIGLYRVLFYFTATFSKYHRVSLQLIRTGTLQSALSFLRLVLNRIFAPVDTDALGQPAFSPDSPLRRSVVDALLTIERCLVAMR